MRRPRHLQGRDPPCRGLRLSSWYALSRADYCSQDPEPSRVYPASQKDFVTHGVCLEDCETHWAIHGEDRAIQSHGSKRQWLILLRCSTTLAARGRPFASVSLPLL